MSIFCSLVTEDCNIFRSQSKVKTLESASQLPYRHMLTGTELAKTLYGRYQTDSNPEEVLGKLYYSPKKPSHIGRYGDDSIFVK